MRELPKGEGEKMFFIRTSFRQNVRDFSFFSPSGLRPPSSSEEGSDLGTPTFYFRLMVEGAKKIVGSCKLAAPSDEGAPEG